jgi:hypothetical protein
VDVLLPLDRLGYRRQDAYVTFAEKNDEPVEVLTWNTFRPALRELSTARDRPVIPADFATAERRRLRSGQCE